MAANFFLRQIAALTLAMTIKAWYTKLYYVIRLVRKLF